MYFIAPATSPTDHNILRKLLAPEKAVAYRSAPYVFENRFETFDEAANVAIGIQEWTGYEWVVGSYIDHMALASAFLDRQDGDSD
jgi:hypothetical protein